MAEIGEIKRGREIGKPKSPNQAYMWHACVDCGKLRWVEIRNKKVINKRCHPCASQKQGLEHRRENHPQWGGGIRGEKGSYAYVSISLQPDDPYYPMVHRRDKFVYEHRLVMAKHLGRCLNPSELVHHRNGDKKDNRIENLELISSRSKHMAEHIEGYISGYQKGLEDGYKNGFEDAMKKQQTDTTLEVACLAGT